MEPRIRSLRRLGIRDRRHAHPRLHRRMLDASGNHSTLIVQPLTESCFTGFRDALRVRFGGC